MKRILCGFALAVAVVASVSVPKTAADDQGELVTKQEGYSVSLNLTFSKKRENTLQRFLTLLDGPNGYATGFVVGDKLVMTSYHVVSGQISSAKKVTLGFGRNDELAVEVSVGGCQARVLKVDKEADLALLGVCQSHKQAQALPFQSVPDKDESLFLIARPDGEKMMVRRGSFLGPYTLRGQQYFSARIEGHDGYSGSPVYNDKAEVVGVFCGYDWAQHLAIISPGERAQKLLNDYAADLKR